MGAGTGCIIGGIILAVIGLGVILIGIVAPLELPQQKEQFLVVDSKNSKQYSDWAGGYDKKNNYQMVFTFFNLSNPDEVRSKAAVPIYTTVGPYIYRRYRQAQDVTFLDDGNQVQFIDFRDYQFDQAASNGLSDLDHIVNVNPVYVSALAQAGGEQNMLVAAGGGYLTNFTAYLTGDFISAYTSFTIPTYLPAAVNKLIAAINATVENTDVATDLFLETWCNATVVNATWEGMMISSFYNVPSGISKASAQALLNASQSLSLYDTDPMSAWTWDRAINSTYYASLLITQLGLTQEQINAIWHWRLTAFGPAFIYPAAIEKYDLDEINDIGYVQWTSGDGVLGGSADNPVSIGDVFPISELGYAIPIELWEAPVEASFPDWRFSKQILNPNVGLGNITIFQTFVMAISMNLTQDYSLWGFNAEQAALFFGYSLQIGEGIVPTALMQLFGPSGGLILDQSVAEWAFNCNPFLSNLLLPDPPYCSLLLNHTVFSNVTIYTGKRNISQINQYIDWQGSDVVSGIWQGPLPVSGCTELGQFVPDLTTGGNPGLTTFNDEFFRTMYLNYTGKSSVRDIDTYQYVLDYQKIFSPNDFYFQTVPGFANITTIKQAPIFYSLWDMLYVDESLKSMVKVLNASATSELTASTVIDVEPITGNTLRARKRLQANVQTPFNCPWCNMGTTYSPFGNTNFPPGTFFPLVQAGEYVEISSELAHQVWLQVNALKYLPNTAGIVACILIGSAVLCAGVVLNVIGCRRRKNSGGYDEIN